MLFRSGGARPGAGRKPKALTEKIAEGRPAEVMMEPAELEGVDVPPVKDFLKSPQKSGRELVAEEVYNETYTWLKARGCEKLVTVQMVEQYAMSVPGGFNARRLCPPRGSWQSTRPRGPPSLPLMSP